MKCKMEILDLAELIELCIEKDASFIKLYEMDADRLTQYAVEVRYPDDLVTPSQEDAAEARQAAERVRSWLATTLPALFAP